MTCCAFSGWIGREASCLTVEACRTILNVVAVIWAHFAWRALNALSIRHDTLCKSVSACSANIWDSSLTPVINWTERSSLLSLRAGVTKIAIFALICSASRDLTISHAFLGTVVSVWASCALAWLC